MDPKILCLGIYPKDIKNDYKHLYMALILTALPITYSQIWKWLKRPKMRD